MYIREVGDAMIHELRILHSRKKKVHMWSFNSYNRYFVFLASFFFIKVGTHSHNLGFAITFFCFYPTQF